MKLDEIKKAWKCCTAKGDCADCPLSGKESCTDTLSAETLTYISKIEAEKKEITEKFNCQQKVYSDLHYIIQSHAEEIKTVKSEAIKEFAERLKGKLFYECGDINFSETCEIRRIVDNLVAEMIGEIS